MNAANTAPTLADFAAWLTTSQQNELDAMNATTGDTFGKHCDHFIALTAAINALREFQQVAAASATTTPSWVLSTTAAARRWRSSAACVVLRSVMIPEKRSGCPVASRWR